MRHLALFMAVILWLPLAVQAQAQDQGRLDHYPAMTSAFVKARDVNVWLPQGYDPNGEPLAVIYMNDGENLFEKGHSFSGHTWEVIPTLSRLIAERRIPPVIVVGIASTNLRNQEYLPKKIVEQLPAREQALIAEGAGGPPLSDEYLKFIVTELKPFIDKTYHSQTDAAHTFIIGSSMGGLIALYAHGEYPDVFSGSASLSTHWLLRVGEWFRPSDEVYEPLIRKAFAEYLKATKLRPEGHKIYVDHGTLSLDAQYGPYAKGFDATMAAQGWDDHHYMSLVFEGDDHSETSWARRLDVPIAFLLGLSTEHGEQ